MRILVIDNYDSFVCNIVGLLETIRRDGIFARLEWDVSMNDAVDIRNIGSYDAIIFSPGPGIPREAGAMMEILEQYADRIPMFGICLGFQAIAEHFGAQLRHLPHPRHGHPSQLRRIDANDPVIGSLAGKRPTVGRYHSWAVDAESLPARLIATSFDEEGNPMSFRHRDLLVFGTQFHPESIITDCGKQLLTSFLRLVDSKDTVRK